MDIPRSVVDDDDFEPPSRPPAWHRPPAIIPNLGAKAKRNKTILPKSKVQHVLLHENKNQNNMLSSKVSHITSEYKRASRLYELHKKSFLVRQSYKQVGLWEKGIDHVLLVPDVVVQLHCPGHSKDDAMQSPAARRMAFLKQGSTFKRSLSARNTNKKLSRSKSHSDIGSVKSENIDEDDHERTQEMLSNFKTALVNYMKKDKTTVSVDDMTKLITPPDEQELNTFNVKSTRNRDSRNDHSQGENGVKHNDIRPRTHGKPLVSDKVKSPRILNRSKTALPLNNSLSSQSSLTKDFSTYQFHKNYRRETTIGNHVHVKASQDPRFQRLSSQLVPSAKYVDTFLQLSPDGGKVVEKYGKALYSEKDLKELLDKYNDVSFMSTRRMRSPQKEEHDDSRLPVQEAFVDDGSLYSSLNQSSSSLNLSGAE